MGFSRAGARMSSGLLYGHGARREAPGHRRQRCHSLALKGVERSERVADQRA